MNNDKGSEEREVMRENREGKGEKEEGVSGK